MEYGISKALENEDWKRIRSLFTSSDGFVWAGTYAGWYADEKLPIKLVDPKGNEVEHVSWKHLRLGKKLPSNKNNILVFCNKHNFFSARQLLEDPINALLFENSVEETLSAIKHINIHGLVVCDTPITESLVQLFNCSIR